ncbi:MAG: circularly permuted type 2 ATP-grasp protein [Planctomycetaceae bacterium]|nr:circularly permuted type 2 ATP-grasp protein [Planctomycetaceae bacterium]
MTPIQNTGDSRSPSEARGTASRAGTQQRRSMFHGYRPLEGVFDEAFTADGTPRPGWTELISQLDDMGLDELTQRRLQAGNQISRDGVIFNPHDAEGVRSRPWLLDAVPLMLTEAEWTSLSEQLAQRARLMEALLKDLFGPQSLLKDRVIPPDIVFGHPAWYPGYMNLHPETHRYLGYYVTDLARAPDGVWWVTGDRCKSPFGLGYILENRIVTSRMLSQIFRRMPVRRLAPFYAALKEQLRRMAPRFRDNPRIVLWTKGPASRSYFEDSYLARYLGYTLGEGGDLTIRNGSVQLKTLGGLLPVEVLLRRVDDDDCDPVELRPGTAHGISGLLEAIRERQVAVTNSVGTRLLESPAFLPFLPSICRYLLSEELQMPSVATWWCGQPEALDYVLKHLDGLSIRPAFRMVDEMPYHAGTLSAAEKADLVAKIRMRPQNFVAQESVRRSTVPVLVDDQVVPWFLALRTFLVSTESGYKALPGALARVSPNSENLNFTMTCGERSQDVWILSEKHEEEISLLDPVSRRVVPRRSGSELPSRVADNLFWLGRYIERAEQSARLLRTVFETLSAEVQEGPEHLPLLRALAEQGYIEPDFVVPELRHVSADVTELLPEAMFDLKKPLALRSAVKGVVFNAVRVRDRISPDMWRAVDRIGEWMNPEQYGAQLHKLDPMDLLDGLLSDFAAFAGLAAESMTRTLGWRFLDLGYRIERAVQVCMLVRVFFFRHPNEEPSVAETLLRVTNSLMTYRSRYLATYQVPVVLDLLVTDETNPRSILYQLTQAITHLNAMPRDEHQALLNPEQKLALSIANSVRLADVFELSETNSDGRRVHLQRLINRLEEQLPKLSEAVSGRFLIHAGLPRHFASSRTPSTE